MWSLELCGSLYKERGKWNNTVKGRDLEIKRTIQDLIKEDV
jgi:hypothetical protein